MYRLNKEQIINIATEFDELGFRASNLCDEETNSRMIKDIHKALNELIELKDIEEELDFDLIILLKALMNGIYVTDDGYRGYDIIYSLGYRKNSWGFKTYYRELELSFSDYGKIWALTKEELGVLK